MKTKTSKNTKARKVNGGSRSLHRAGRCVRVESEVCPDCRGSGREPIRWMHSDAGKLPCIRCFGTGIVERIAPTVRDDLSRNAGGRGATTEDAE